MKSWQKGIELDTLLEMEKIWSTYNDTVLSPFLEMKKNSIASALDKGLYEYTDNYAIYSNVFKSRSKIKMYSGYDIPIASVEIGERVIYKIAYNDISKIKEKLESYEENTFIYIFEESNEEKDIVKTCGYEKVGVKINTFGDVLGVYFKGEPTPFGKREFPEQNKILKEEYYVLRKMRFPDITDLCESIKSKLKEREIEFTNHYSNYNKKNSWSAISLRGYTEDFKFIIKPEEMNKKWKEQNKDVNFNLQDTSLRKDFPEVEEILSHLKAVPHRIRFMNLTPQGGELQRHTDQVDPDAGVVDKKLMRVHFPIVTNENVIFEQWDCEGYNEKIHMKVGECWYIDVRKPHRAVNGGDTLRTHLVIDLEANDYLRSLL